MAISDYSIDTSGTPQDVQRRQKLAEALMKQGSDTSPAAGGPGGGWITALNRGLAGALAGYQSGQARAEEQQGRSSYQQQLAQALGSGGNITPQAMITLAGNPWANPAQTQAISHVADMQRQSARDAIADKHWAASYALQKQAAARADQAAERANMTPLDQMEERGPAAEALGLEPGSPEYTAYLANGKYAPAVSAPDGYELNPEFGKVEGASRLRPISGGPQDPAALKAITKAKEEGKVEAEGPGITISDDAIGEMAKQARAGDTSVFTNLGRGAQGPQNIARLREEITRQNKAEGVSGQEQALRNAEYFGVKAGQRTIGTKGANIEMAATEFNQVLPVVQEASKAVSRTNYPDLNKIILAYETKTGDPNVVKLGGGINTLINLYARAISPTGVGTVSDKDHAREILSAAWAQGQFDAATGMMEQEIKAALASPEKVRDEMRARFLKGQGAAPVGYPAPGAPKASAPIKIDGYEIIKN